MPTVADWALERIAECAPGADVSRQTSKINDLLAARIFFDGRSSQLFGLVCDLSSLDQREKLTAACDAALRAWLDVLSRSDPNARVELYRALTARGDFADVPAPAEVVAEKELVRERSERLGKLEGPTATLAAHVAVRVAIEALSDANDWLPALSDAPPLPTGHRLADFTYFVRPEWSEVSGFLLPPDFLPIADAGTGDFIGVLLDASLLRRGLAPVVLYFHEHDPAYTWAFESSQMVVRAIDAVAAGAPWSEALRGKLDDEVRAVLHELNDLQWQEAPSSSPARTASRRWLADAAATFDDPATLAAYQNEENRYAATHLGAQAIWVTFDSRIQALLRSS